MRPSGARPPIAFIAAHYSIDFSEHYLGPHLATYGYGFLGWNTRFRGHDHLFVLDRALVDVGVGVAWLRSQGAEVVVLLGNSGGGSLMAAYNAQARAGAASAPPVISPARETQLLEEIGGLPVADLYVSLAAHPGRPDVLTNWLDPSVGSEEDPAIWEGPLDMYAEGVELPYDRSFVDSYRAAQVERNNRITAWAEAELERLARAGMRDRMFSVARTWADPRFMDATLDPSERPTPACYRGDPHAANRGVEGLASVTTLRTWLSMWSLQASQCRGVEHLGALGLPALVIQASQDCGVFPSDAQAIYDLVGSRDKQLVEVRGDHYFGSPAGARQEVASVIAQWLGERVCGVGR